MVLSFPSEQHMRSEMTHDEMEALFASELRRDRQAEMMAGAILILMALTVWMGF